MQSESIKNIKGEVRYNMSTEFYDNALEDFRDKVSNKELANVLNVVNYLQKSIFIHTESYPRSVIRPNRYSSRKNYNTIKSNDDLVKEFNIEMITEKIDNDEPVVLGVKNPKKGHALLGYKYEYINNNTVKLYISDSNIVFSTKKPADNAEKENIAYRSLLICKLCLLFIVKSLFDLQHK